MTFNTNQPIDSEERQNHDECNDRRGRCYVRRTREGWVWYCHNCGEKGFRKGIGRVSLHALGNTSGEATGWKLASRTESPFGGVHRHGFPDAPVFRLPLDYCLNLPTEELVWLHKYLTDAEIRQYQIGYSPQLRRIILPIHYGYNLVGYQARSLHSPPKYLTYRKDKIKLYYRLGRRGGSIVLVEDMLSCMVLNRCIDSACCLGSPNRVPDHLLGILGGYDRVYVWLDWDKRHTSLRWCKDIAQNLGKPTLPIFTKLDPKCYTKEEILCLISKSTIGP